ncbi:Kinesin-like protein KIN-7D, mitochondrial [Golovinomyces cichoracearum]|uniref:Kinesin-like protein n=1 Tax=Golovinomyces cichoracearum TaxID=62708 RepID=A0A420ILS1_9PEZI|nr:Kinesin-like protein KIN-7D, mitochondrial [Golovinomyces cichoracearum]
MAAAIPRHSRPSYGSPATVSPVLTANSLKPCNDETSHSELDTASVSPNKMRGGLHSPLNSNKQPLGRSIPLPKHKLTPNLTGGSNSIKRQVSINAFPHPPRVTRTSSLPPSPLSGHGFVNSCNASIQSNKSESIDFTTSGCNGFKKNDIGSPKRGTGYVASISNGTSNAIFSANDSDLPKSECVLNLPSPPQSRSSSQGSNPILDENKDSVRGREPPNGSTKEHRLTKSSEAKGNVLVSVRVRPDVGSNKRSKTDGEWMVDGRRSLVAYRGKEGGDYYYDNVFTSHDNNAKVYDSCAKRLVRRVMEGYHGTVFAYGMTGTGKTFSMQGTATSPGVIPLAITDIFSYIRETPSREFLLRVSYLEIYNEKIHDLLIPSASNGVASPQTEEIKLREDSKRGVYASSLKEEIVQSPTQLLRVIARGDQARRTSSTQFNSRSSRSHAVVQIVVESRERVPGSGSMGDQKRSAIIPNGVRVSTLSLIDLAGSERAAETKERRKEGSHINKSLLTLGTVIAKLSGNKDREGKPTDRDGKHLPYRDSKLTRLLQGALSGNSLVSILCTIQIGASGSSAPSNTHTSETLNTLKFASRAKNNLVSHAKKAEEASGQGGDGAARVLLERYRIEIQELRSQLEIQTKSKLDDDDRVREKEAEVRHDEQMLEMQLARTALKERIEHLNRLILSSKSTGVNSSGTFFSLNANQRHSLASNNGTSSATSARSSLTPSALGQRSLGRSSSQTSISTVAQTPGQRSSAGPVSPGLLEDEDSLGEFGDGNASLAAQNRALQADLADKTRYCQTLEKRLIQARRSSHSRASIGFSNSGKTVTASEDLSMTALIIEKDMEIAELKARLDDKDRMLAALRSSVRSRDIADRDPRSVTFPKEGLHNPSPDQASQTNLNETSSSEISSTNGAQYSSTFTGGSASSFLRGHVKSVEDLNKTYEETTEDRVEAVQLAKGIRGGIRIINDHKTSPKAI